MSCSFEALLAFLIGTALTLAGAAQANAIEPMNSHERPKLPPLVLASPTNVYGNTETVKLEQKILAFYEKTHSNEQAEIDRMVDKVASAEELERLSFWSISAETSSQHDSDLNGVFWATLTALKKRFPAEARERVYELADLVFADGGVLTEVHACIIGVEGYPLWPTGCCSVWAPDDVKMGWTVRFSPQVNYLRFNLTRTLRQKWYQHWTGKGRFLVRTSFELESDGSIKNIKSTVQMIKPCMPAEVEEARKAAEGAVKSTFPFKAPYVKKLKKLEAVFRD